MSSLASCSLLLLILLGCAVSPTGSNQTSGVQDQDWLIKLATYRVRDETILKSQDKTPLNMEDLRELILKELSEEDLLDLIDDLGVSPKLLQVELSELASLGAPQKVLLKLGQLQATAQKGGAIPIPLEAHTQPLAIKPIQKQKLKEAPHESKKRAPQTESAKQPLEREKRKSPSSTSKTKQRHPSDLSSDSKMFLPPITDPNSLRY